MGTLPSRNTRTFFFPLTKADLMKTTEQVSDKLSFQTDLPFVSVSQLQLHIRITQGSSEETQIFRENSSPTTCELNENL